MEKFSLKESEAFEIAKNVLREWYGFEKGIWINKYYLDDGSVSYDAFAEEMYRGEIVKRLIPLRIVGMIKLLRIGLEAKGYENVYVKLLNQNGKISFSVSAFVASYVNRKGKRNGLYMRRKNR